MFEAVARHGGYVADATADSMVAVWTTAEPDAASRVRACRASLDILDAVAAFNRDRGRQQLPTRIGLESGDLVLGNVGAGKRFEYRAIGDIVNTASRLQGLSRVLGTRVLVSDATLAGTGLPARDLGSFLLRGKTTPVRVHEPLGLAHAGVTGCDAAAAFAAGLASLARQDWSDARRRFAALAAAVPGDGPTDYYLALCSQYEANPPRDWRGFVNVT